MRIIRILLLPFSFLYGLIVLFRNWLFDLGIFKSQEVNSPTVVLGNLHAGGTGKTPHTIFLATQLQDQYRIAILSRGYGRSTSGFRYVNSTDRFDLTGDEALIFANQTAATVAVCEDRVSGINRLEADNDPDLILLDDAFQHRKLKAAVYLLLVPYHKPLHRSYYLPSGELRDHRSQVKRANAIIVTGTPKNTSAEQQNSWVSKENYPKSTSVFFSEVSYGTFCGPLPSMHVASIDPRTEVIVISGIAHPERFTDHLSASMNIVKHLNYKDHYAFKADDLLKWKQLKNEHPKAKFLTTEKDAMRILAHKDLIADLEIYYLPIEVKVKEGERLLAFIRNTLSQPNNSKNLSNS